MRALKYIAYALILILAAIGLLSLIPQKTDPVQVYYPTDFSTAPDGIVGFESYTPKTAREIIDGGKNSAKVTGGGLLVMPSIASAKNPVPAVVILHGSGGDWTGRSVYLANRLAKHGIAGFAVDSFVARDLRVSDDYYVRLRKAPIYAQMADAMKALEALQDHPAIDNDRIAVTGFSLGAAVAIYTMFEPVTEGTLGTAGPRFSAHASFYSGCSLDFEDFRPSGAPLLIMMGEHDESMDISQCEAFEKKLAEYGVNSSIKTYTGAGHGWEQPYPQAFVEDASVTKDCFMVWTKDGYTKERNTGKNVDTALGAIQAFSKCATKDGYTMGLNEFAKEQSWQDLYNFLMKVWEIPRPDPTKSE